MFQIIAYIKFFIKSTNQHGVHSPFVYSLITKCFYDKKNYDVYSKLRTYRTTLLEDKTSIAITDLGSGSKKTTSKHRQVREIAKTSGTTLKRAKLLYRIANYFKPSHSLELGTSLGIATQALALGASEQKITTIEGCPNISEFTAKRFKQFEIDYISIKTGDINKVLPTLEQTTYDLVFFDGNHKKEATLEYFHTLLEKIHNDTVFIFDDIHWSKGMTEAWKTIKDHPKVTVTIDTFFWGLVFFRKEQQKENFIIRV